jgi:hypothetical protein
VRGATKAAAVLLSGLFMLMTSCELPASWITVLSDDFNRVDSADVGNGWAFVNASGSPASSASISGNELLLTGGNTLYKCAILDRSISLTGDFRVTFDFSFPGVLSFIYLYVVEADMDRYAMGFQPGSLGIFKDGTGIGGVSPTLDAADSFSMEIIREAADITVVLTDATTGDHWEYSAADDSYYDFASINLWGGYFVDSTASSVAVDDFVLQTR